MTNSNLNNYLKKNKDYVFVDKDTNIILLINTILQNKIKYYLWDNWASIIHSKIK